MKDKLEEADNYKIAFHKMKSERLQAEMNTRDANISKLNTEIQVRNLEIVRLQKEKLELLPLKQVEDRTVSELASLIEKKYEINLKVGDSWEAETGTINRVNRGEAN